MLLGSRCLLQPLAGIFATKIALLRDFFSCLSCSCCFGMSGRFWQELLEVLQQVRSIVEKLCDLSIDILDRL
jgi:hypothetical protein